MISDKASARPLNPDDFSRDVYCVLGMPVDAIEMGNVLLRIREAALGTTPFLISTPNLNFLVNSLSDIDFRESLLRSDLCLSDGMPIVWIARRMGVPIKNRVAGSDVFDALIDDQSKARPLKVFFFGGAPGVAAAASRALNARSSGVHCVGLCYPGFGTVEEMSHKDIIRTVNSSCAELLVVSLGAKKGQAWLLHNHDHLKIPVRVHLGAVMNFQAGTVGRAPVFVRKLGLEWMWRIYEEPHLWRRYWADGWALLGLLLTRIVPLAVLRWRLHRMHGRENLTVTQVENEQSVVIDLAGSATALHVRMMAAAFESATATRKQIIIDFSRVQAADSRFFGLLLMLNKRLRCFGEKPTLRGLSPRLKRLFRLHGLDYLLLSETRA